jgi:hypothetical protein
MEDMINANTSRRNWVKQDSFKEAFEDQNDIDADKTKTVRAKSIENKRRRLLAETIQFQRRFEIMKKRRA